MKRIVYSLACFTLLTSALIARPPPVMSTTFSYEVTGAFDGEYPTLAGAAYVFQFSYDTAGDPAYQVRPLVYTMPDVDGYDFEDLAASIYYDGQLLVVSADDPGSDVSLWSFFIYYNISLNVPLPVYPDQPAGSRYVVDEHADVQLFRGQLFGDVLGNGHQIQPRVRELEGSFAVSPEPSTLLLLLSGLLGVYWRWQLRL